LKGANLTRGIEGPQAFLTQDFSYANHTFYPCSQEENVTKSALPFNIGKFFGRVLS
jgi:hypothetical protein